MSKDRNVVKPNQMYLYSVKNEISLILLYLLSFPLIKMGIKEKEF